MLRNRRRSLQCLAVGAGTGLGGLGCWVAVSKQRGARVVRRLVQDAQRKVLPATAKPNPAGWSENEITLCWLGHTTVLINFFGLTILTDPVLMNQVGVRLPVWGTAGMKRYIAPALRVKELPSIDVLLLSHAHMDHMDLATLRQFPAGVFTVSAAQTTDLLKKAGRSRVAELRWGERTTLRNKKGGIQIESFEVKHWGQRWPSKIPRGYNGYVLRRGGRALLFGGDTARTTLFRDVRSRGPFEVAIMPIGAYRPWIWNHCSPEQALDMANAARAKYILPVHHQTFKLGEEPMLEPIERFQAALNGEVERLAVRRVGETFVCPKT